MSGPLTPALSPSEGERGNCPRHICSLSRQSTQLRFKDLAIQTIKDSADLTELTQLTHLTI